jgi:hypothetical protein
VPHRDLPQSCPLGLTAADLETVFGARLPTFHRWMTGQTVALCDGRQYNHAAKMYEPAECFTTPHGIVTYRWDVERFLDGLPVID